MDATSNYPGPPKAAAGQARVRRVRRAATGTGAWAPRGTGRAQAAAGILGLVVAMQLVLAAASVVDGQAAAARPIYFWPSVAVTLRSPDGPPLREVSRPAMIGVFADGSWVLERLRWRGWGSNVATATGISSASNGIPNMAQGKRIKTRAEIRLYSPGTFFGRSVYRCFAMKVPPPATSEHGCLHGAHGFWLFLSTAKPTPTESGVRHLGQFFSPDRRVWCSMEISSSRSVSCGTEPEPPTRAAVLTTGGRVAICTVLQLEYPNGSRVPNGCYQNWPLAGDDVPVLKLGQATQSGGVRCTSASDGITCALTGGSKKGKGFRINQSEAVSLG